MALRAVLAQYGLPQRQPLDQGRDCETKNGRRSADSTGTPIEKPNFAHMSPLQSWPVACAVACRWRLKFLSSDAALARVAADVRAVQMEGDEGHGLVHGAQRGDRVDPAWPALRSAIRLLPEVSRRSAPSATGDGSGTGHAPRPDHRRRRPGPRRAATASAEWVGEVAGQGAIAPVDPMHAFPLRVVRDERTVEIRGRQHHFRTGPVAHAGELPAALLVGVDQ